MAKWYHLASRIKLTLSDNVRLLHSSSAVQKSKLGQLRKRTGFSLIQCKKALQQFDNDLEQSEKWLRDEAQKEGWAKATKLQNREMSSGLIGVLVDSDGGAIVEVNCETDFVSRNSQFQSLVSQAARACIQHVKHSDPTKATLTSEQLGCLALEGEKSLADLVALEVGSMGENMAMRRGTAFKTRDGLHLASYVHSVGLNATNDGKCQMGKYGALLTFSLPSQQAYKGLSPEDIGRQLGQHIVGMNPAEVGDVEEDTPNEDKEEERRMVHQEFLLDSSRTVAEFLQEHDVHVHDFTRYECGEILRSDYQKEDEEERQRDGVHIQKQ